jgi:hypothetical protein
MFSTDGHGFSSHLPKRQAKICALKKQLITTFNQRRVFKLQALVMPPKAKEKKWPHSPF